MEACGILKKSMCEQKAKAERRQFLHVKHATEARAIRELRNGFEMLKRMTLTDGEELKSIIIEERTQSPKKFTKSETSDYTRIFHKG